MPFGPFKTRGPHGPLLVTTGFSPVPLVWSHVTPLYRWAGFDAETFPFSYANVRCVENYAEAIAGRVRHIRERTGRPVRVLGLSMGGIATLYAIKRLGSGPDIAGMVAMGSPFHGSPLATFGIASILFLPVGTQLRPGSRFLTDLHADAPPASAPPIISIGGTKDRVCPLPTTVLAGARHLIREFSHLELLTSVALHTEAVELLRGFDADSPP